MTHLFKISYGISSLTFCNAVKCHRCKTDEVAVQRASEIMKNVFQTLSPSVSKHKHIEVSPCGSTIYRENRKKYGT
jgi:hypothetical protein